MGYLNNASITVDAILTTKGRELLSNGSVNGLDIKYFALGDDEVNYDLWNPAHPLGSDYYGIIIENMPVLEASPLPSQNLKSKLITLPQDTNNLAYINNAPNSPTFVWIYNSNFGARSIDYTPSLSVGDNNLLGYTCYFDTRYISVDILTSPTNAPNGQAQTSSATIGAKIGLSFKIKLNESFKRSDLPYTAQEVRFGTNVVIEGNGIGGRITIPINLQYTLAS